MKTIGLIGGVSWVSTSEYYNRINLHVNSIIGDVASAKLLVYSFNFLDILPYQKEKNEEKEVELLINAAKKLQDSGADVILICSNTTSKTTKIVQEAISIPIANIIDATTEYLIKNNISKVAVLGTKYVMYDDFYTEAIKQLGIDCKVPTRTSGDKLNSIIYSEFVNNIFTKESIDFLREQVDILSTESEKVILACTELPIAFPSVELEEKVIDCIDVHIKYTFDKYNII